ncbi:protein FAR1-RELATED SEQUENCE 5-like isoform X2 [Quercus suber]|uniref:protein FAR1-RELATED SEQUENCE 5-like isoform X2 n=1 Tax=Quercus suber TaxID=58331 RepID=UPI0032DEB21B
MMREFSQNMDANEDLSPTVMDANEDLSPRVGMEFDTLEDAWEFWLKYGRQMGFDVRKHYINKSKKDGKITSRGFVCAKQGIRGLEKEDMIRTRNRDDTRTNCPVKLYVSLVREIGKYKVTDFIEEHNHTLHLSETVHMMRSQRKISEVHAGLIELASSSGIKPKAAHELMSREAGGRANLGFTELDQYNYLRTRRQKNLIYGQAACLLGYFQEQLTTNPSFQYAVQLDNVEQITNIFWADARMIIDYSNFGDVVTFDTTYGTNKELRPLGVFTGFNHHRGLTVFGAALLYDETAESFKWLFERFLVAHVGKRPKTIFTDQDPAMAKALSEVMPNTYHGLCTWHIMQNGIKHLGNLMKDGSSFLQVFKTCMFEFNDEIEFEKTWEDMIDTYAVHDRSWLDTIYKLKGKWAKCYMKNEFTLGIRSTQLSESLNGDLKDYLRSYLDVAEFFEHFDRVIEQKRERELQAEFNARQKFPQLSLKNSPLLKQAIQVYTPVIFRMLQDQYDLASATRIKNRQEDLLVHTYIVEFMHKPGEFIVSYDTADKTFSCSCRKFEIVGILCCHVLKVFDFLDIKTIPDMYILKRRTREAKSGCVLHNRRTNVEEDVNLSVTQRYRRLCPKLVRLASRAADNKEAFALIEKMIDEYEKKVEAIAAKNVAGHQLPHQMPLCSGAENLDPNQHLEDLVERAKGLKKKEGRKGGKRKKSWVEKQTKKRGRVGLNDEEPSSAHNMQYNNYGSHGEHYSHQTYLVSFSTPMMTSELGPIHSYQTSFTSFLRAPLTPLLSQVSNIADVSQAPLTPSLSQLTPSLSQVSNDAAVCQSGS